MKKILILLFLATVVGQVVLFSGTRTDGTKSMVVPKDMVLVEGGTFNMGRASGDPDEKDVHPVTLTSFYIDKFEVTNQQFCEFLNQKGNQSEGGGTWLEIDDEDCLIEYVNNVYRPKPGFANNPVIEVSWYGATMFAKWAGKRLPTEAEWEYAARGGKMSKNYTYAGSNSALTVAWYDANANQQTQPVGKKTPNELSLYDMSGNVWEWCSDWYDEKYYSKSPTLNPKGPAVGKYRVLRGGAWVSVEVELRTTLRDYTHPNNCYYLNGFRCVKDL